MFHFADPHRENSENFRGRLFHPEVLSPHPEFSPVKKTSTSFARQTPLNNQLTPKIYSSSTKKNSLKELEAENETLQKENFGLKLRLFYFQEWASSLPFENGDQLDISSSSSLRTFSHSNQLKKISLGELLEENANQRVAIEEKKKDIEERNQLILKAKEAIKNLQTQHKEDLVSIKKLGEEKAVLSENLELKDIELDEKTKLLHQGLDSLEHLEGQLKQQNKEIELRDKKIKSLETRNSEESYKQIQEITRQKNEADQVLEGVKNKQLQLDQQENQLNQQENQLNQKENQLNQKENQLIQQENQLNQKENQLNEQQNQLNQKENQLNQKENQLNEQENQFNQKCVELKEKENEKNQIENQINQKENQMTQKEYQLNQRENQLIQKENQLNEKEYQLNQKENQSNQKENEFKDKVNQLEQKQREIEQKETLLTSNERRLKERELESEKRERALNQRELTEHASDSDDEHEPNQVQIEYLKFQNKNLEEKNQRLEKDLFNFQQKISEIEQKKTEIFQLKQKNEKLEVEKMQEKTRKLESQIQTLQTLDEEKSQKLSSLEFQKQQLEMTLKNMEQRIQKSSLPDNSHREYSITEPFRREHSPTEPSNQEPSSTEPFHHSYALPFSSFRNPGFDFSSFQSNKPVEILTSKFEKLQQETFQKISENQILLRKLEQSSEKLMSEEVKHQNTHLLHQKYEQIIIGLKTENKELALEIQSLKTKLQDIPQLTPKTFQGEDFSSQANPDWVRPASKEQIRELELKWKAEKEILLQNLKLEHQNYVNFLLKKLQQKEPSEPVSHNDPHLLKSLQERDLLFKEIESQTQIWASKTIESDSYDFNWLKDTMRERIQNLKQQHRELEVLKQEGKSSEELREVTNKFENIAKSNKILLSELEQTKQKNQMYKLQLQKFNQFYQKLKKSELLKEMQNYQQLLKNFETERSQTSQDL